MMLSPQSMCGVYIGLCLPRRRLAMIVAKRPRTQPSASTTYQLRVTSAGLAEYVFIFFPRSARQIASRARLCAREKVVQYGTRPLQVNAERRKREALSISLANAPT